MCHMLLARMNIILTESKDASILWAHSVLCIYGTIKNQNQIGKKLNR